MKGQLGLVVMSALTAIPAVSRAETLCEVLQEFVDSVKTDETRELTFRTSWGGDFKDSSEQEVMFAKRCDHGGYAPAKMVCEYLMEKGAVEFAGNNVKDALACLSPQTRFAPKVALHQASFSFAVGTDDRGALVEMDFYPDEAVGGMAFKVVADGY